MRRLSWYFAFAFLGASLSSPTLSQDKYPNTTVRIVYAGSAGSTGDVRARLLAEKLSQRLNQKFVVDNKPGAGATLAATLVKQAKADGYTLLASFTPNFAIGPRLYRDAQYDPLTSFTPIAIFSRGSPFLVVNPSSPAKDAKEFAAIAKSAPKLISFAHGGLGGSNHLPAEMWQQRATAEILHVAYKSEALALPDILSGRVSAMFMYSALAVPQIKAGTLRTLGYAGAHRNAAVPDIPTIWESGFPGFEFYASMILLGPAGMPQDTVSLLTREVKSILEDPEVRASYAQSGADPLYGSPEQLRALIAKEIDLNGPLISKLGIAPE